MIIIGLGNPTEKHRGDRHNLGYMVLDAYAAAHDLSFGEQQTFLAQTVRDDAHLLAKPTTWMNDSGLSAKKLFQQYKELPVIVYDDIDISLGDIKCSLGRSAGGHNGVQSIIDHLGTKDFFRIRVGVRPVHEELQDAILPPSGFQTFLLKPFAPFEEALREQTIKKAVEIIEALKTHSFTEVMTKYN